MRATLLMLLVPPASANDQSRMAKQIAALEGNLAAEREKVAALQARIDALMLEYCPAEMTQAQRDNWEAHQCVK